MAKKKVKKAVKRASKKPVVVKKTKKMRAAVPKVKVEHLPADEERLIKSLIARDEVLVDNFVGLQKALVNVSIKFNDLSDRIDKLLTIYQKAADVFVDKQIRQADQRVDLNRKYTNVIKQNKMLARRTIPSSPPVRRVSPPSAPPAAPPTQSSPPASMPQGTPSIASQGMAPNSEKGMIPPAPEDSKTKPLPQS